jgi:hypothetical protein
MYIDSGSLPVGPGLHRRWLHDEDFIQWCDVVSGRWSMSERSLLQWHLPGLERRQFELWRLRQGLRRREDLQQRRLRVFGRNDRLWGGRLR